MAKFYVGRPQKSTGQQATSKGSAAQKTGGADDEMDVDATVNFNEDEDKPYLEGWWFAISCLQYLLMVLAENKRRQMKAKGLRVRPRTAPAPGAKASS